MRKRTTAVLAVAGLAPLTLAAPALAAPGNGAERYSFSECYSEELPGEPAFESCFTIEGRVNVTETRSGNVLVNDKGTFTSTFTSGDLTASDRGDFKFNAVFREDQDQVIHSRSRVTSTIDGVTCSGGFRYIVVRGEVKKEIEDFSCDGPVPEP